MKRLTDLISGLRSLGAFGLVFLLMAGVIAFAAAAAFFNFNAFTTITSHVNALRYFQDDIGYDLGQAQIDEVNLQFYVEQEQDIGELYGEITASYDSIQESLVQLGSEEDFSAESADFSPQSFAARQDFEQKLANHRQALEAWKALYDQGEADAAYAQFPDLRAGAEALAQSLADLVITLEKGRADAIQALPSDVTLAVWGVSLSLVALLLLALWGYHLISSLTQPLLALTNTVMSIGGDQYRKELLQNLDRRGDMTGALAKALDGLAQSHQRSTAGLKQENESLRQQLYTSRRKRLRLFRPQPPTPPASQ